MNISPPPLIDLPTPLIQPQQHCSMLLITMDNMGVMGSTKSILYVIKCVYTIHHNFGRIFYTFSMASSASGKVHKYKHAAVATDHSECSRIGRNILQHGGSAVDSAIASMLCLGVVHPHSTGIGGGGFMLVYHRYTKFSEMIDFRENAPLLANKDMFHGDLTKAIMGRLKPVFHLVTLFARTDKKAGTVPTCSRRIFSPANFKKSRRRILVLTSRRANKVAKWKTGLILYSLIRLILSALVS